MPFFYKDTEGKEIGPVDQSTLLKWVEEDRLVADSQVRNAMLKVWKNASDLDFLREALERQQQRIQANEDAVDKTMKKIRATISHGEKKIKTSFVRKYNPKNAAAAARIWAFVLDSLIFLVLAIGMFGWFLHSGFDHAGKNTPQGELAPKDNLLLQFDQLKEYIIQKQNDAQQISAANSSDTNVAYNEKAEGKETLLSRVDAKIIPGKKMSEKEISELAKGELKLHEGINGKLFGDNEKANSPPNNNADESAGYQLGSRWFFNAETYVCLSPEKSQALWTTRSHLSADFTIFLCVLLLFMLLYYTIMLGIFAQTFGMWFFGIFVCSRREERELGFVRCLIFTVLMLTFGIFSPLLSYLFGASVHDILCGVRVASIAGDPI